MSHPWKYKIEFEVEVEDVKRVVDILHENHFAEVYHLTRVDT
jgi:hypothetical protein